MTERNNPYIQPENYFAGYQESIDKLKLEPEALQFDKLCYQTFVSNNNGKKLMDICEERFLLPSLVPVGSPDYQTMVTYYEGFKEAFRLLKTCVNSHEQRIKAD